MESVIEQTYQIKYALVFIHFVYVMHEPTQNQRDPCVCRSTKHRSGHARLEICFIENNGTNHTQKNCDY